MSKHLADRRQPSEGGRVKHFLTIAREGGSSVWMRLYRRPRVTDAAGRRVVEFARIDRGRRA